MLDEMREALPKMTNLHTFRITCPFSPPASLLISLAQCDHIKDFRIVDTPLSQHIVDVPDNFKLERLTLVPVGEVMRWGEGPLDLKFRELQYFLRTFRKLRPSRPNLAVAHKYIFDTGLTRCIRYLEVSSIYLRSLQPLTSVIWPHLETLVLTGPTFLITASYMAQVVVKMPKLFDLRLVLSKRAYIDTTLLVDGHFNVRLTPGFFSTIKHLALSNSFEIFGLLRHAPSLERLSIGAIASHPQIPIAMRKAELIKGLEELQTGRGNLSLKKIRLMTEETLTVEFFETLGGICPNLEFVEVEVCGYIAEEAGFEWVSDHAIYL